MTLYGIDVHPQFQAGLDIEEVAREGFGFLSVKLTQGTSNTYETSGSAEWISRGKAAGLVCLGYAYLEPGDMCEQATVFARSLARCDVPGVMDVEALDDNQDPVLAIGMVREFSAAATRLGARVSLMYLPRWYWERIGSPDLTGLPPLWASSYPGGRQAPASDLFEAVTPRCWTAYGGLPVAVLQFADTALVAGHAVDANAFLDTREAFAAFVGATPPLPTRRRKANHVTHRLDPTPLPTGAGPDVLPDGTWTTTEDTITTPGPVGGWSGRTLEHLTFGYRGGFVQEAWSGPSGHHYVDRWDPGKKTGGRYFPGFATVGWELPAGDRFLVVRYATRAKGSVTTETEH